MIKQAASKPEGWQETVGGVKQACWCGKEWGEGHEDAAAHVHGASEQEQVVKSESEEEYTESDEEELEEGWTMGWYGPVRCEGPDDDDV